MLKKLQGLLFEDDDEELEEAGEVVSTPQVEVQPTPAPVARPVEQKPVVNTAPVMPKEPEMEPVEKVEPVAVEEKPVAPQFDNLFEEEKPVEAPKPQKPLGITIGEPTKPEPKPEVKKEVKKPVAKTELPRKQEKKETTQSAGYQFKPVISPIFGVDEKDLTAVKNTAVKLSDVERKRNDRNMNSIISPMYGSNTSESLLSADNVEEDDQINTIESLVTPTPSFPSEDDIPEFSLDDILKVRDEEFEEEKVSSNESTAPFVFDFDGEDEVESIDETLVMKKEDFTKSID